MLKVVVLVVVFALVVYALIRLLQGRDGDSGRPAARPPRPVAPDDDAAFLRDLDRKRRQRDDSDS